MLDDLGTGRWMIGDFQFYYGDSEWSFSRSGIREVLKYIPSAKITSVGNQVNITYADFDVIVVDEAAKACFSTKEVQFFPIQISNLKSKNSNYFIMTIVNEVDCLDERLSEYDIYEESNEIRPDLAGNYKTVYKMVIDSTRTRGLNIFRISKYDTAIIVSENLKKNISELQINGVKFKEV
jgi:hypothetical protein